MINKYLTLLIIFCGLISQEILAQNQIPDPLPVRYYIKATAGYDIGINGEYFTSSINGNVTNTTSKIGNGLSYSVSGGYQYNNNLGAELGLGYEYGFKNYEFPPVNGYSESLNGNMLQITPSVVFSTRIGRITTYIRTGLILASPELFINEVLPNFGSNPSYIESTKIKFYGALSTGFQTAMGCSLLLQNKKWIVFAEASFSDIGYLPQKSRVYYETINGVDQLSNLSVSEKEEVFQKSYSYNTAGGNSTSQPLSIPEFKYPFGSIAFNLGVKMNIGNSKVPETQVDISQHCFVRASIGYGIATNGDINYQASNQYYKAINVSYGNGMNEEIGFAYMIDESLGFDLSINEVTSSKTEAESGATIAQKVFQLSKVTSEYGNMIQLNPSIAIGTHIKKLEPYARFGMIIGYGNVYYNYEDHHALLNGSYFDRQTTMKYYSGASVGYNAVLGTGFWLSYKCDLIVEACFNNIYETPEKSEVIRDDYNGTSNLGNETISEKQMIFKSSYDGNSVSNPNSPTIASPVKFSFNAAIIRVGLRIWIRTKKES